MKLFEYLTAKRIPQNQWNYISRSVVSLRKDSNIIGVCVTTQLAGYELASFALVLLLRLMQNATDSRFAHYMLQDTGSVLYNIVNLTLYTLQMFLPFALLCFGLRISPLKGAGAARIKKKKLLLPAVVVSFGVYGAGELLTVLISALLNQANLQPKTPDFKAPTGAVAFALYVLMIAVFAPLFEEFIFRGVILHRLRRYGDAFAIVASAAMFGLLHGNLGQAPYAFVTGLALGYFTLKLGSVWVGVIIHCSINTMSVIVEKLGTIYGQSTVGIIYAAVLLVLMVMAGIIIFNYMVKRPPYREHKNALTAGLAAKNLLFTPGFLLFIAIYVIMNILNLKGLYG